MKKIAAFFLAMMILSGILAGCGEAPIKNEPADIDASLICSIYEAQLPEFSFVHIYGDPSQQPTWFWTGCDMKNTAIVEIVYDEETFEPSLGEIVYSFGDVAADEAVLLYMEMPEGFPTHAFSYTCEDKEYCYAMGYSGLDGSTTITAFEELF